MRAALAIIVAAAVVSAGPLPQDRGAAGTWQLLQKLGTTASAMHTTAHPDDEHGGMLAMLSRGAGARVSLLTLTRGESGDNAIGPQLFDALGLIRTEELLAADRYYGVDAQFFTTVADYGFSKRLDEALEKWGKEAVLRDVVRIIRIDRPFVLISRFQGNERDGHGNHSAAGLITQDAFKAAGDPRMFPEQIAEGLRPWQPFKVYIGGARENETWSVRVDTNEYSPWLGDTYENVARQGLSFQRSQNGGRYSPQAAARPAYYARVGSIVPVPEKESGFFDGIDTTIPGLFSALRQAAPAGASELLGGIDRAVNDAGAAFSMATPQASLPALARGLRATRAAITKFQASPEAQFVLRIKERQFQDAIAAALGIEFTALATVPSAPVPGQTFEIVTEFNNRSSVRLPAPDISIEADRGWSITPQKPAGGFLVALAPDVPISTRSSFARASIAENRYRLIDPADFGRPAPPPPAVAVASFVVDGETVRVREVVRRREPKLPYGDVLRELRVVPALSVTVEPPAAIVSTAASGAPTATSLTVDLLNNAAVSSGLLALRLPEGWTASPPSHRFTLEGQGKRQKFVFTIAATASAGVAYNIAAVATMNGRQYAEGYEAIDQRDLELRYVFRPATASVRGVSVLVPRALRVGYVMGIGDRVPEGIAQLGHTVTLLSEQELAAGDLQRFDSIVTGTRAYAVRDDLNTYSGRLLDYVRKGGNLIVLYNTAEMAPARVAPYPGELTLRAEEVSEEDSPVTILTPADQVFNWPNRITKADFDGWVEQRGSKFWSSWSPEYTPMIETFDKGQPAQRGGWLSARLGAGHYTYFAYALHRQLPYAVPGAYRILENLLALGSQP